MNEEKVTLVEFIGDRGEWIWHSIHKSASEKEAIKSACEEMDLPCGRIKQESDGFYSQLSDVRAYKVTLQ